MANEPWKIFYHGDLLLHERASNGRTHSPVYQTPEEQNNDDQTNEFFQYLSILHELYSSIAKGKIDLKDSEKVSYYLKQILEVLPGFNSRLEAIHARKHILKEQRDGSPMLQKITMIKDDIEVDKMSISEKKKKLGLLESELSDRQGELQTLASQSQTELCNLVGQHFEIMF